MIDRRSAKRIPVTFRINFGPPALGKQEGTVRDITITGCRLQSPDPIPLHAYLELWIQISPTAPRILVELAAVRWMQEGEAGIEFLTLRPEHKAALERLTEGQSEGPRDLS